MDNCDLLNIAPFTLIISTTTSLTQYIWDEVTLHKTKLNPKQHYIWSSVTLYDKNCITKRKEIFEKFIATKQINAADLFTFHQQKNETHNEAFIINRECGMQTFSVSQAVINSQTTTFKHKEVDSNTVVSKQLPILKSQPIYAFA